MDELYCQLYVDIEWPEEALVECIARLTAGSFERRTVRIRWGEIDVETNFYDAEKARQHDGFLYYRYVLEIFRTPGVSDVDAIRSIGELILALRAEGAKVVAACDFEEQLPDP